MSMRVDVVGLCALAVAGCSSSSLVPDAPVGAFDCCTSDGPPTLPGIPGLGAHALAFFRLTNSTPDLGNLTTISTSAMPTQASGSTIVVSVGRGLLSAFELPAALPTDNQGNTPYAQLGSTHKYERWPSGTALYAFASARGGAGHTVSVATPKGDEVTLAAVEVLGRAKVQDFQWNQVLDGPLTSLSVKTTGAATLVAFWWGDGFVQDGYTATPNNGFTVINAVLEGGSLVQCAVAVKDVAAAGTYNVTWTATPPQGAQLWLVAVQ